MSDSNRGRLHTAVTAVFAVTLTVLILAAVWSMASDAARQSEAAKGQASHYAQDAQERIQDECIRLAPPDMAVCVREIIEATREDQRSEADLRAQQGMELWAFWMMLLTAGSVFVTGVGVIYVRLTLREAQITTGAAIDGAKAAAASVVEARETTNLSRKAFLADQRPWVTFKLDPPIHMTLSADVISIQINVVVMNSGRSPAIGLTVHCIACDLASASNYIEFLEQLGTRVVKIYDEKGAKNDFIGPSEIRHFRRWIKHNFTRKEIDKGTTNFQTDYAIIVSYAHPFSEERFFSGMLFSTGFIDMPTYSAQQRTIENVEIYEVPGARLLT
jgi:hypothetical protein